MQHCNAPKEIRRHAGPKLFGESHVRRIPRILLAMAISLLFNILLLVLSLGNTGGRPSIYWRAIDVASAPSTRLAEALFSSGHSPASMVIQGMICSFIYYSIVAWVAIKLLSWLRTLIRRRRAI